MPMMVMGGTENSPLLSGSGASTPGDDSGSGQQRDVQRLCSNNYQQCKNGRKVWTVVVLVSAASVLMAHLFTTSRNDRSILLRITDLMQESHPSNANRDGERGRKPATNNNHQKTSPYHSVQTLSFQIFTGGAPAFITDKVTGEKRPNPECIGLNSYGLPEDSTDLQCYLGLEDTAADIHRRLTIMADAVDKAYDVSNKDDNILKIFIAPEFFFRGVNGAFEFHTNETRGECSEICHILQGLENIVANKRFENWLFLFGTIIASETLPTEDTFDYQFYNFAPLYKGYDPAKYSPNGRSCLGKNFIVPKRYVSNIDFLTPARDMKNQTMVMELLDSEDEQHQQHQLDKTLMNPHASGIKRYGADIWVKYKDELTSLGYTMIEYGWFYMDGISFSVEICLDHLVHRALMTYMADVVTGSKTKIPSSTNDVVEWVGIPRQQAQISLVSSAGMGVVVASLALRNGGYIFLQDGMEGDLTPHSTFGEDDCQPNELEFYGGSQCVKRTALVSATDVTFEYEMNLNFEEYDLYSGNGESRQWRHMLKGVFSRVVYQPRITVYDPVTITTA
ncbi:hypothetical protein ACHAXH_000878 [Discostella pseudostelligera]